MSAASKAREQAGLTLPQAAKKLRMAPSTLEKYERSGCGEDRAREIARLYCCPMELFLYGGNSALAQSRVQTH